MLSASLSFGFRVSSYFSERPSLFLLSPFLLPTHVSSQRVCCLSLLRNYHALTRYSIHAILGIGGGGDGAGGGSKPKSAITCPTDRAAEKEDDEDDDEAEQDSAKKGGGKADEDAAGSETGPA